MHTIFKIQISKQFTLKCSLINEEEKEIIIKEIIPSIKFNTNTIDLQEKESENVISFMKQWIENPDDYSTYSIEYQDETYNLLPEVLFAIIVDEIKKEVEKEYIIDETILISPTRDYFILERLKISLESIGLTNISFSLFSFDYSQQGEYLYKLLEKKKEMDFYKKILKKAEQLGKTEEEKKKLKEVDLNKPEMRKDNVFEETLKKKFSIQERSQMKMCTLDNYCLFITSRYFDSLQDHINREKEI